MLMASRWPLETLEPLETLAPLETLEPLEHLAPKKGGAFAPQKPRLEKSL